MIKNLQDIIEALINGGIENPRLEARCLVAGALQCQPDEISHSIVFDSLTANKIEVLLQRRLKHEPLDKIIGQREFYKYNFIVSKDVLSPRPETELLVEKSLVYLEHNHQAKILDLGAGSGCIIESILKECPEATGVAVDVSAAALRIAEMNAQALGVTERLSFIRKNWFDLQFKLLDKFDVIVCNPPYIPSADILTLETEVKDYDPLVALDGGIDGLASYRRIAKLAVDLLKDGGYILLEVGKGQAEEVVHIFSEYLTLVEVVQDLAGVDRCVIMQKLVAE